MSADDARREIEAALAELHQLGDALQLAHAAMRERLAAAIGKLAQARDTLNERGAS